MVSTTFARPLPLTLANIYYLSHPSIGLITGEALSPGGDTFPDRPLFKSDRQAMRTPSSRLWNTKGSGSFVSETHGAVPSVRDAFSGLDDLIAHMSLQGQAGGQMAAKSGPLSGLML